MSSQNLLIIDDEPEIREILEDSISHHGFKVFQAGNADQAEAVLKSHAIDIVISDIHMPGRSGVQLLEDYKSQVTKVPQWVFMSADASTETIERAVKLGALDVIQKPFDNAAIEMVLKSLERSRDNTLNEIMEMVQKISGVQLGSEKKLLVETRLLRRARLLDLSSIEEYMDFFKKNRASEVNELISLVTTHTTEFFREPDHFDYLYDQVFPEIILRNKASKIWSAASSSGQELYSLAISWLEFLREKGISFANAPKIEFLGTDIDFASVETASDGIYEKSWIDRMNAELVGRYFDFGEDDLKGFVKIKDIVHGMCRFEQMNLLSASYTHKNVDIVFLRNVLIYFKPDDVKKIVTQIESCLTSEGYLFVGHSESLTSLSVPYKVAGNAIYRTNRAQAKTPSVIEHRKTQVVGLIKVLIVDDSITVRKMLSRILSKDHGFEVIGEAENPIEADKLLTTLKPDLMTLDIHMPEMDGVTYLEKLGKNKPFQIVMISSINYDDAIHSLKCFELGAVDYIEKPQGLNLNTEAEKIRIVLKGAVTAKKRNYTVMSGSAPKIQYVSNTYIKDLILIGASTGGVEAIKAVLTQFPDDTPPILIVQHIPPVFSTAFAKRLDECCKIKVKEGVHGEEVVSKTAYLAPGGKQMKAVLKGEKVFIEITDDAPVNRHKPSVDYLFNSIASQKGFHEWNLSTAILTGMGADGARGVKSLKDFGSHTIAQDEDTCVVFGMPKEAIALGGVIETLPLHSIAYHLFKGLRRTKKKAA